MTCENAPPTVRVLVVDDEPHQLDSVCRGLQLYGYRCQGVAGAAAALEALEESTFDLVLVELGLPGGQARQLVERAGLPVVAITGLADPAELAAADATPVALLSKPFDPDTLDRALRRALGRSPRHRSR